SIAQLDPILDGGSCTKERQVELPLESFLNDLHVQQAKEAAAKPETEGRRGLRLVQEGRIVELEFLQRFLELLVLISVRRKESGKHHRGDVPIAGEWSAGRAGGVGHRAARAGGSTIAAMREQASDFTRGAVGESR